MWVTGKDILFEEKMTQIFSESTTGLHCEGHEMTNDVIFVCKKILVHLMNCTLLRVVTTGQDER